MHPFKSRIAYVGQVIFGAKVPAGRLIQTVYPESYAAQVSIFGARTQLIIQARLR